MSQKDLNDSTFQYEKNIPLATTHREKLTNN